MAIRCNRCTYFHSLLIRRYVTPMLFPPSRCNHTAWIEIAIFVFVTLLAQIFLTVRSVYMFHTWLMHAQGRLVLICTFSEYTL